MDCSALLTRQLSELKALISRLRTCDGDDDGVRLFAELSNRAVLHVLSRERVLLPAGHRANWKDFPLDAMTTHVLFKRALAHLLVTRPWTDGHHEALSAFAEQVELQHLTDHQGLIPVLRDAMDIDQRRALCNDVELLFEAGRPPLSASGRNGISPYDLIHEAEVVLSMFANPRPGSGTIAP